MRYQVAPTACHVCGGNGHVPAAFYNDDPGVVCVGVCDCRACAGTGNATRDVDMDAHDDPQPLYATFRQGVTLS